MNCQRCGYLIPNEDAFCPNCGSPKPIVNSQLQNPPNPYPPSPYQPQANQPGYSPPPPYPQNPYPLQNPAPRRSLALRIVIIVIAVIAMVAGLLQIFGAFHSYGTKLTFNGSELYYTKNVTEAEARKLGDALVKSGWGDKKVTIQLDKAGETYQVRLPVKEGLDKDEKYLATASVFAADLSKKVFNGAPVEIHLCDDHLKTLKVVPMKGD